MRYKIKPQRHSAMTESDWFALANLLNKAGYTTRSSKERPDGKTSGATYRYVEYGEE